MAQQVTAVSGERWGQPKVMIEKEEIEVFRDLTFALVMVMCYFNRQSDSDRQTIWVVLNICYLYAVTEIRFTKVLLRWKYSLQ